MPHTPVKTAIITPDLVGPVRNGGIGTFVLHFTRLLRQHGHEVCIVFTAPQEAPRAQWQPLYDSLGVEVIHAYEPPPVRQSSGSYPFVHHSTLAARHLPPDTDVIYTQDWLAHGFYSLRARRYASKPYPVFVNVLNSSSAWLRDGMELFPDDAEEHLSADFGERYVARHSDFVAAPSRYVLEWVRGHGWALPPDERVRVLGYPFLPDETLTGTTTAPAPRFKRLVFFGRLETRKGVELFVEALLHLRREQPAALHGLAEIVFLGKPGVHRYGSPQEVQTLLRDALGLPVVLHTDLDTHAAQRYLADHAADTLAVMPSLTEVLGFTVIEASLIPGLNLICSANGGMPEVLGAAGADQWFMPYPRPLADTLARWLAHGPRPDDQRGHYDWQARNAGWLAFHEEVCAHARQARAATPQPVVLPQRPLVDICIPYFNHASYLPQTLAALEHQTTQQFNLYVVNDASTDARANAVFAAMAERYAKRGWHFSTNAENQGLSATRNTAAGQGSADYLLFVDSDNVPAPNMVERFVEAIHRSGDDCLTCYLQAFEGDAPPYTPGADRATARILYTHLPLGNCPELGFFVNCFGDANFIIRREVFAALGGFDLSQPHYRYITGEDHAFLARLSLAGCKLDVLPEYLLYYRHHRASLSRSTPRYQNIERVQAVYRAHLREAGLEHLSPLAYGQYLRAQEMPGTFSYTDPAWMAARIPWYALRDAFWLKLSKHLRRLPFMRR